MPMSREGGRRALDRVVERIVTGYEPDRIILFGSQAREGSGSDGDIDLLIVKESGERPADRRVAGGRGPAVGGGALVVGGGVGSVGRG